MRARRATCVHVSHRSPKKMEDIARLAGVSKSTVSRALAGSPLVSEETRKRIEALARDNAYRVNEQARGLRLRQSRTVACLIPLSHEAEQPVSDPFFLELVGHIADALASHGYDLLLSKVVPGRLDSLAAFTESGRADGLLLIGQSLLHTEYEALARTYRPMVVWGALLPGQSYVTVGTDNAGGARRAVSHLIELGRRRIAFLGTRAGLPEIDLRYRGYADALEAAGIPLDPRLVSPVRFGSQAALNAVRTILGNGLSFDAIFAASDVIAMSAIRALQEHGLRVPQDVSVVGYDDVSFAAYYNPALTTVRQDLAQGGRLMVDLLLRRIDGQDARSTVLPTELVVRASCGGGR
jgi:DNA-binding LacI/PurR family transcriptional regulator